MRDNTFCFPADNLTLRGSLRRLKWKTGLLVIVSTKTGVMGGLTFSSLVFGLNTSVRFKLSTPILCSTSLIPTFLSTSRVDFNLTVCLLEISG